MIVGWAKRYIDGHPFGKIVDIDHILAEHSGIEMERAIMAYIQRIDDALDREMHDRFLQNTRNMERYDLSGFKEEWIE